VHIIYNFINNKPRWLAGVSKYFNEMDEHKYKAIFDFDNCIPVAKLKKPHSSQAIYFLEVKNDPFLLHEITFKLTSGAIVYYAQIIAPDLKHKLASYQRNGYIIEYQSINKKVLSINN
jgi:hypothetical protein